jgi:hypothetical protein
VWSRSFNILYELVSVPVLPPCLYLWPQSQEKEARDEMKRRAKELQMAKKESTKRGGRGHGYNVGGGFGSADYNPGPSVDMSTSHQTSKPAYNPPRYCHPYIFALFDSLDVWGEGWLIQNLHSFIIYTCSLQN